jgi:Ricin-type beta-trefoil lectin domain
VIYAVRAGRPDGQPVGYRIRNVALGLCIAARGVGESPVIATTCAHGAEWPDQIWSLHADPNHPFTQIRNNNSGNCLAARGTRESQAVATTCGAWLDQYWVYQY